MRDSAADIATESDITFEKQYNAKDSWSATRALMGTSYHATTPCFMTPSPHNLNHAKSNNRTMNYNERNRPPRNIIRTFRTDIDTLNKAQLNADAMGVPVSTYIHSLIANHQP